MLHASAVFLCLASFLQSFEPSKCRSTGRLPKDDNQTNHIITLCLEGCFLLTSSRQACSERCLRGRKELQGMLEVGGKRFSTSVILNPLLRRRKRNSAEYETDISSLCSSNEVDNNVPATIHTVQRHRYENSNTWYVNISWYPMDEARNNFMGYAVVFGHETKNGTLRTGYFKRAKNETYLVYNESENGWKVSYGYFGFEVITLPCLSDSFPFSEDLRDYLPSEDPATLSTGATTTNATTTSKSTTSTPKKSIRVLIGCTVTFGGLVLITAMICVLRRKCHKESIVVAQRIPPAEC